MHVRTLVTTRARRACHSTGASQFSRLSTRPQTTPATRGHARGHPPHVETHRAHALSLPRGLGGRDNDTLYTHVPYSGAVGGRACAPPLVAGLTTRLAVARPAKPYVIRHAPPALSHSHARSRAAPRSRRTTNHTSHASLYNQRGAGARDWYTRTRQQSTARTWAWTDRLDRVPSVAREHANKCVPPLLPPHPPPPRP